MTAARSRYTFKERLATGWIWWCLGGAIALGDFATKQLVRMTLPQGDQIPLTGFFNLLHASNADTVFSMLAGAGGWQRYFFTVVAVVISTWLFLAAALPLLSRGTDSGADLHVACGPLCAALGRTLVSGAALSLMYVIGCPVQRRTYLLLLWLQPGSGSLVYRTGHHGTARRPGNRTPMEREAMAG